jgi:SSS family solute:Na+ symporter
MQNVLELMLYSYAFMVSGLFVPVLGAFILEEKPSHRWVCFFWRTILLIITENKLPLGIKLENLDANLYGISISLLLFVTISIYHNNKRKRQNGIQNN